MPVPAVALATDDENGAQDFFYICPAHLTDRGFATAIVDEAAEAEKKKKEEMDKEIEKLKKEYEEKVKRKEEKKKDKDKDKDKDKGKGKEKVEDDKVKTEEEEKPKPETAIEVPSFSEYQLHRYVLNRSTVRRLHRIGQLHI
ncbi:hypothetical protein ABW20_dc0105622 [Dactylellina cionopaga]|nr:hypothetical protein ABW20_dc0105622 [Dactylellina cionopaga]